MADPGKTTTPHHRVVRIFSALSDENRFRIVHLLSTEDSELTCGAIGSALGLSPSLISHHLSILEGAELIERRKDGLCTLNRLRRSTLAEHLHSLQRVLRLRRASDIAPPLVVEEKPGDDEESAVPVPTPDTGAA